LLGTSIDSTAWLLYGVLWWAWVSSCLSCVLTYTSPDMCPRMVQQGHK
jgi:hypothetical protein